VSFRQVFGNVFPLETVLAAVVFGLVVMAMLVAFAVSRRKRRLGTGPAWREHLHTVEAVFGVALTGMAAFLVFVSFTANAQDFPAKTVRPAVTVHVTAFQWCWRFQYPGSPVTVTGACTNGSYPVLEIPAGVPVKFDVDSVDVVHAFWVPYLDAKIDAFPGHTTTFTTTVAHPGEWIGRCDQFCGLYHSEMDFWLKAVPPAQFRSWLKGQASAGAGAARAGC
jgi:cytochrome c oxidase subunit II